ncbi:MAG: hypothetical protein QOH69_1973 [Actinomycetota bacterium]|jgi:hypothetical protein|nr:hypothetical protein [Actinomycetota bacterium]
MKHRSLLLIIAVVAAVSLSGCATTAPAPTNPPLPTAAPTATGTFNEALAYQSAWHVEARGKYFSGSMDTCDLNTPISIEDAAALANADTQVPVFGAVFRDGGISYGTVWPTPLPGTGIESGTGTYSISYDGSGLPVIAHGTATVKWHDAKRKPAIVTRHDTLTLTFTRESRADRCQ